MSALKKRSNSLAGLSLDAVLGGDNPKPTEPAYRSNSVGLTNDSTNLRNLAYTIPMSDPPISSGRGMFTRGPSMRVGSGKNLDDSLDVNLPKDGPSSRSFKPQFSRNDSVRDHSDGEEDSIRRHPAVTFVDERTMSAREAVADQEAAEAEASSEEDSEEDETEEKSSVPKQTMSLMDLLEETDRQMGLTGSTYAMEEEEEEEEDEEEEDEEEGEGEVNCCVCMVKIKGPSLTPCGHTFCKLCSKELMAQKDHCPVCSSFVLEFLEIF